MPDIMADSISSGVGSADSDPNSSSKFRPPMNLTVGKGQPMAAI